MSCRAPLSWDDLLAYWLGELDADAAERSEEHYLGCAACSDRLEALTAVAHAVRDVVRHSGVNLVVNEPFVRRLADSGLRVREYRVALNGSVNCTVAPEDDVVVAHLEAPLEDVQRLDMVAINDGHETRLEDVPFVALSGSVVFASRIDALRALPASINHVWLYAVDDSGERMLGEYRFNHTPHPQSR